MTIGSHFFQHREFVPRLTRRNRRSCWWTWMWSWGVTTAHLLYSSTEHCSKRYLYNHLITKKFLLMSKHLWKKNPNWYWKGLNTMFMISSEVKLDSLWNDLISWGFQLRFYRYLNIDINTSVWKSLFKEEIIYAWNNLFLPIV